MSKKIPLGQLVDGFYRAREKRLEQDKQARETKKIEDELRLRIIEALKEERSEIAEGKLGGVRHKINKYPTAKDWDPLTRFIYRHKEISLLQRRINVTRFHEILEDRPRGVPGIEIYTKDDLELFNTTKGKRKG